MLAAVLALQPQAVQAQAFQGTETVILGNVSRGTSGTNDFFIVNALQNTINWVPTDTAAGPAPINFLPAGATASFSGGSGTNGANYTVLNRIIAADQSRAIQFAGSVSSDSAGRIWFYAPGGLLLAGTSRFNVGSLLLTANDPAGAAAGLPYLDAGNRFRLQAAATSTAAINTEAGAQINAISSGSYVIAVAPRFTHAGAINVNGSAALAAVSDASFTLNGGLFDITANVGSDAGNSSVTGSITGPAGNSGQGVYNRVYLMAVPRNDAMTLLISGGAQIGFDIAGAADIDGNAIVLSGGYDIRGAVAGGGLGQFGDAPVAGSVGAATIRATAADLSSNVAVRSKNVAEVMAQTGAVSAARDLEIFADTEASAGAANGNTLFVGRNLTVDASNYLIGNAGANRTAGNALVNVLGASAVQAGTRTTVRAVGTGDSASGANQAGGNGSGGTAQVNVSGGSILNSFFITVDASGTGGDALAGRGGSGTGGNAFMQVNAAGQVVTQFLRITASGLGSLGESGQLSGNAQGGTARLTLNAATAGLTQTAINVEANASYKVREGTAHLGAGRVTGGTVSVDVQNGSALTAQFLNVNANALSAGGSGNNEYFGGNASLIVSDIGGSTSVAVQSMRILASATASDGQFGGNTAGGAATGGFARLLTTGNPTISGTQILVSADAVGGNGADAIGGNALGGRAHLDMQNGGSLLISGNVDIGASTVGGNGTIGGSAAGWDNGDANPPAVFMRLGRNVGGADQGIQIGGGLFLDASASGGLGSTGVGGAARGGFVVLRGQSGTISANSVSLLADATGGFGVGGGAARSGRLFGGFDNANLTTTALTLNVDAAGGSATDGGRGGDATVGQVFFLLSSLENGPGTVVNAGSATLLASARGGAGGGSSLVAGDGGNAFGIDPNATELQIAVVSRPARSSFIASQFVIDNAVAGGEGGAGFGTVNGGRGGNALGGQINIGTASGPVTPATNRSTFDFGSLYFVDGRVTGGAGGGIDGDGLGGRGGDATGGSASLLARGTPVTAGAVSIDTSAFGGNGGNSGSGDLGGGNAAGGESLILATPHFTSGLPVDVAITGPVTLTANGQGGSSRGVAGIGQGGAAYVRLQRHEAAGAAPVTVVGSLFIDGPLVADASGLGGTALGFGATGGAGIGGAVDLIAEGGSFDLRGGALLTATGAGAPGFTGNTGLSGGAGGAATGGTATVTVRPGGNLTMPNLAVDVSAQAGLGGDGGTGQFGAPPGIPLPGQRSGNPGGDGLLGGNGGAGGAARGGNITIGTDAANSGGSITISSWSLSGEAVAGPGGTGGTGGAGADGAAGLDGDAVSINGGNGGAGGNGGLAGNAGAGGSAFGGNLLIGAASNDQGTPWSLSIPLLTANMQVLAGGSGSGGQGGTPGLGGAGGAAGFNPGPPPVTGQPGQAGANGFFGGQGLISIPGLTAGAALRVLLFNANFTAQGIDLSADVSGPESAFGGQAGDAQAGSAELVISGGPTSLGYIRLSAIGTGGQSLSGIAGSGRGGSVIFRVLGGADVTLGGRIAPLQLVADGYGGDAFDGGLGGSGFGGSIVTQVNNARLQVNGTAMMAADAFTGNQGDSARAVAGTLDLRFEDGSTVGVTGQLVLVADATGPIANGGQVAINGLGNGSLTVDGGVELEARAAMRQGFPDGPTSGGTIQINTQDGNSLNIGGQLTANASAGSFTPVFDAVMAGGSIAWSHRGTASVGGAVSLLASATFNESAGGNAEGGNVLLSAGSGSLSFGDLSVRVDANAGTATGGRVPGAFGGTVTLNTDAGATLAATGFVNLSANARGSFGSDGEGGDAQGGNINISSAGSLTMNIADGNLLIEAIGYGGSSTVDAGGTGRGGIAAVSVAAGGDLIITGQTQSALDVLIFGVGGNSALQGGSGFGGAITLASAGTLSLPSGLTLAAGGTGGTGGNGAVSGNGSGGAIGVVIGGGLSSFAGDIVLDVNATVPGGTVRGDGTGGSASVAVNGGALDVAGSLIVLANGAGTRNLGGAIGITVSGGLLNAGNGADLQAHSVNNTLSADAVIDAGDINVTVGAAGELRVLRFLSIDTFATGISPLFNTTANAGTIAILSAGTVALGGLRANASAVWQSPMQEGGASIGGSATLTVTGGSFTTTELLLTASAVGGNNPGGGAGAATGGFARLLTTGNPFVSVAGSAEIAASARAGQSDFGAGGEALGGRAHLDMQNGGTLLVAGSLTLDAFTRAGDGATGGNATAFDNGDGGPPAVFLRLGTGSTPNDQGIQVGANLILEGRASAGNSTDGIGGTARGGLLSLVVASGNVSAQTFFMGATAIGGAGNIGGNARSGRMFQRINNANVTVQGNTQFEFDAIAGNGVFGTGSLGGEAIIGQSVFTMSSLEAGTGASFTAANLLILARAVGGAGGSSEIGGGAGGNAFGSDPNLANASLVIGMQPARSAFTVGQLIVDNSARGGAGGEGLAGSNGGAGGTATRGFTNIGVISGPVTPTANQSTANLGDVTIFARNIGGDGGSATPGGLGGRGGDAVGGAAIVLNRGGILTASSISIDVAGEGGSGGSATAGDLGAGNGTGGDGGLLATPHFTAALPGQTTIAGAVTVNASGAGGNAIAGGGDGRGGMARIELKRHEAAGAAAAAVSGSLTISGNVQLESSARGGSGIGTGSGGNGFGGTSLLFTQAGTSQLSGLTDLLSIGGGGQGQNGVLTGNGNGGQAQVTLDGGSMTISGNLFAAVRGQFGEASGGDVRLTTTAAGGSLLIDGGNVTLMANAISGDGFEFGPAQDAFGGGVIINVGAGSLMRVRRPGADGTLTISADAEVRNTNQFSTSDSYGGGITITADGRLEMYGGAGDLTLSATSRAGAGGALLPGGEAFGGGINITANPTGSILFDAEGQLFGVVTNSYGGDSGVRSGAGGGSGIRIDALGGTITVAGATSIQADGFAGNGAPGGDGTAGGVRLNFDAGGTLAFGGALSFSARGSGVNADGGFVGIASVGGGTMTVAGDLNADLNSFYTTNADNIELFGGSMRIETAVSSVFTVAGGINLSANAISQGLGNNALLFGGGLQWNHRGTATIQGAISAAVRAEFTDGTVGAAAGGLVSITALTGVLTMGRLDLSAAANAGFGAPSVATGGRLEIGTIAGTQFNINGGAVFNAEALGSTGSGGVAGGDGQGGSIRIANAGIMRLTMGDSSLAMVVDGTGGDSSGGQAGVGRGGSIQLTNEAGGSLIMTTAAFQVGASARGRGGDSSNGGVGGGAAGGSIAVSNAGFFEISTGLSLNADARSGDGLGAGDAVGGAVSLAQSDGFYGLRGELRLEAEGNGGSNQNAGNGIGGTLDVNVTGGTLDMARGGLTMLAGSNGLNAAGGTIRIFSGSRINVANGIDLQVDSRGGHSSSEAFMLGGNIAIDVIAGGRLQAGGRLNADASTETDQVIAGQARAGTIALNSAGTVVIGTDAEFRAQVGHDGIAQTAGLSTGGDITVTLTGGTMTAVNLRLAADAVGMDSFNDGGASTSGNLLVALSGGAQMDLSADLLLDAGSYGGSAQGTGNGGLSTAGTARVTVNGAGTQITARTGRFFLENSGGIAQAGQGGDALGGVAELLISGGGAAVLAGLDMVGESFGGSTFSDGTRPAGSATASTLRAVVDGASGGTLTLGGASFDGDTFGGDVVGNGGAGGAASGGIIQIGSTGNGGTVNIGNLNVSSYAKGGYGGGGATPGNGGAGQGGSVAIGMGRDASSATPGSFTATSVDVFTGGLGGSAGDVGARSGAADGGSIRMIINGASGIVTGGVRLQTYAEVHDFGVPAAAIGGRIELGVTDAGDGSATGTLTIGGTTDLSHRTINPVGPLTPGVLRVSATGTGSRLALLDVFTASKTVTGAAVPGFADRSGIVAGVGARIDFTGNVKFTSDGDIGFIDGGTITATGEMFISSGGRVLAAFGVPTPGATGLVVTPKLEISANGDLELASGTTGSGDVILTSITGEVRVGTIDANRDITLSGVGGVSFTSLRADRTLGVLSNVAINGGSASAGGRLIVQSDGSIAVGVLDSGTIDPAAGETASVFVRGLGPVTTGAVASAGDIGLLAQGTLASGSLQSGRDVVLLAGGTITTGGIGAPASGRVRFGDFAQRSLIVLSNGLPDYTALFAAAPTAVSGNITVAGGVTAGLFEARTAGVLRIDGAINAALGAVLNGGSLRLGSATTQGFLELVSVDSVVLGDLASPGLLSVTSNGSITVGNVVAGQSLVLSATQSGSSLTAGNVRSGSDIRLSSATALTTGSLSAGNRVFLTSGGNLVTGAIDAGTVTPSEGATGLLFATSPGTIRTGDTNVSGSATLSGVQGVNTGEVRATKGIALLDTGGVTTGSLITSQQGFVYISNHLQLPQITFDQAGNPVFTALLAAVPQRLDGLILIGGAVNTGQFVAAATGSFTASNINAQIKVLVDVGGLAALRGSISSPEVVIRSSDLDIGTEVGIGRPDGSVRLVADSSVSTMNLGTPGAPGTGIYNLSDAELRAVRAGNVLVEQPNGAMTVAGLDLPSAAPVGSSTDFTLGGSLGTGAANGTPVPAGLTLASSGTLQVTGAVRMGQAQAANRLTLFSGTRIEVVQDSGSIQLGLDSENPAGTLTLAAPQVRVATAALLSQIAAGTLTGDARTTALNAPLTRGGSVVGRIGAGTIQIRASSDVLIQNSGAATQNAGFTAGAGGLAVARTGTALVDVVINGRIKRPDNSFAANRDTLALVRFDPGASILTANSAVNSCLVTTGCLLPNPNPEPEPEPAPELTQPIVTIVNNIQELTPEQEEKREAAEAATEKLPIVLLQRLIDFSPLFVDPDTTDPVTSGGNPALWMDPMPRGVRAPGGLK